MLRVTIIIHGKSPMRQVLLREIAALRVYYASFAIEARETSAPRHAHQIASKAGQSDLVISCGGDGTHNEVVSALLEMPAPTRPAWSFIAAGSANDFSRIFTGHDLREIIDRFVGEKAKALDAISLSAHGKQHFAVNMSTAGIGAEIAALTNQRKSWLPTAINYYSAIVWRLLRYQSPLIRLSFGTESFESNAFLVALGNANYAGNGLGLCPQAAPNDGALAITVIGNVGVFDFLRYQATLKRCEQVKDTRLIYTSAKEVTIEVLNGKLPIETDGEFVSTLTKGERATFEILPAALKAVYDFD